MSAKTRLERTTAEPGFIRKCVSCRERIEPGADFYLDLDSDDDICVKCGDDFVAAGWARVV